MIKRSLSLLLLFASVAFAQQESYDQLLRHWDYDHKAPLAVQESGVQDRDGIKVHDLSYAVPTGDRAASLGPNGGRVTAYLVVPPGKGPFPAVIYGHWCMPGSEMLNRTEFLDEAVVLARSGVIALLPDHVIARPGFEQSKEPLNTQQIDVLVQQVTNMRRGADLLLARKDVDGKRLAYAGHSCDAEVGGFLSGIDKRFKAVVLMAGPLSDEVTNKAPVYQAYRQKIGPEKRLPNILQRIPQNHRSPVRTAHGTLGFRQLRQQPLHLVLLQRHVDLDRGVASNGGGNARPHFLQVHALLFTGNLVEQFMQHMLDLSGLDTGRRNFDRDAA